MGRRPDWQAVVRRKRQTAAAIAVARSQGMTNASDGVRGLVLGLLSRVQSSGPATDLEAMAALVGIARIDVADLDVDGELIDTDDGLLVRVDSASSLGRRRFTIAHEIGHALLIPILGRPRGQATCGHNHELERLCDLAAAELLMPVEQLNDILASRAPNVEAIPAVAQAFGVSLQAAALRMCENVSWCTAAALVEPGTDPEDYEIAWTAACSSHALDDSCIQSVVRGCLAGAEKQSAETFLGSGGQARRCVAEAVRLGRTDRVLLLIRRGRLEPRNVP